jgi:predicted transcriptional regulator
MARLSPREAIETGTLFPPKKFSLVEIGGMDAEGVSDHFKMLRELVLANQEMYPEIEDWFSGKVIPGLINSQRLGYVAYEDERPIASAVLKIGDRSKFCHLRIHQDFQDIDLGQVFFTLMTLQIRNRAKEIHFSLPESLWEDKRLFFESFGFTKAIKAPRQYRPGEVELFCSAALEIVKTAAFEKLPKLVNKFSVGGYSLGNRLLISMKPRFAEKVVAREKTVEIRKRFSAKWIGCQVAIYATEPKGALVGEAIIRDVISGSPEDIWSRYGTQVACTWEEYRDYAASSERVFAIQLQDVHPYIGSISIEQAEFLVKGELRPPQSYLELGTKKPGRWSEAVSIASILHGHSMGLLAKRLTLG